MTDEELLFATPDEILQEIGQLAKARRIDMNLKQKEFAAKIGIAPGTYALFEQTGKISLQGMIRVLSAFGMKDLLIKGLRKDDIEQMGIEAYVKAKAQKRRTKVCRK